MLEEYTVAVCEDGDDVQKLTLLWGTQDSFIISSAHPRSCKQTHENRQHRNSAISAESHGHGRTDTESSDQQRCRAEADSCCASSVIPTTACFPGPGQVVRSSLKSISGMKARYFGLPAVSALSAAALLSRSNASAVVFPDCALGADAQTPSLGFL